MQKWLRQALKRPVIDEDAMDDDFKNNPPKPLKYTLSNKTYDELFDEER